MTLALLFTLCALPVAQTDGVTVKAVAIQELRIKKLDPQQKLGTESIWVRTEIAGDVVKQAIKSGNLKVSVAKDDLGADLIGTAGGAQSQQPALKALIPNERSTGKLDFEIKMKAPARGAKKLTVKGSIDLITVGERVNVDLKLKAGVEMDLKHSEFDAAGLKLKTGKSDSVKGGDKLVALVIEGGEHVLLDVEMVDAAGKSVRAGSPLTVPGKTTGKTRFYPFPDKVPPEYTLRVVVAKGAKTVTVPFEITDLDLP